MSRCSDALPSLPSDGYPGRRQLLPLLRAPDDPPTGDDGRSSAIRQGPRVSTPTPVAEPDSAASGHPRLRGPADERVPLDPGHRCRSRCSPATCAQCRQAEPPRTGGNAPFEQRRARIARGDASRSGQCLAQHDGGTTPARDADSPCRWSTAAHGLGTSSAPRTTTGGTFEGTRTTAATSPRRSPLGQGTGGTRDDLDQRGPVGNGGDRWSRRGEHPSSRRADLSGTPHHPGPTRRIQIV